MCSSSNLTGHVPLTLDNQSNKATFCLHFKEYIYCFIISNLTNCMAVLYFFKIKKTISSFTSEVCHFCLTGVT